MQSLYQRIRVYAIEKWPFFWNLSSNLHWSLVFLYANSLYARIFLESLSLEYIEVHLYSHFYLNKPLFLFSFNKSKKISHNVFSFASAVQHQQQIMSNYHLPSEICVCKISHLGFFIIKTFVMSFMDDPTHNCISYVSMHLISLFYLHFW